MQMFWIFWNLCKALAGQQITNTVGNSYKIVSKCNVKDTIHSEDKNCAVYMVADVKTGRIVGFVGLGQYGDISVYGPLAKTQKAARCQAYNCARNRYLAQQALAHSNTR